MLNLLQKKYYYNTSEKIFGSIYQSKLQNREFDKRRLIAKKKFNSYLSEISLHHSISVMDKEVNEFINLCPENSIICDIGGSWGWHWRNIKERRPDIKIIIVDFVFENLLIARKLLKNIINKQIFLVNDDCNKFFLKKNTFHGVWSVQTLQHIKNCKKIYKKIFIQLRKDGYFYNINLNNNLIIKLIYTIFKKKYIIRGNNSNFFIQRSDLKQKNQLEKIFKNKAKTIYSELLFHPDIKIFTGSKNNLFGKLDSCLTGSFFLKKLLARQEGFLIKK